MMMIRRMMMMIALSAAFLFTACGEKEEGTGGTVLPPEPETPALNALWVKAGGTAYYAVIDQDAGSARIADVRYTDLIDETGYALSSPRATISPDPKTLLGKWQREQTLTVALDGKQKRYDLVFTDYEDPSVNPDEGEDGIDYPYSPGFAPKDDEKKVYERPGIPFTAETMPKGAPHPNKMLAEAGWKLFTVNEFSDGVESAGGKGVKLPFGLYPHNTAVMNESAVVRNDECARVEDGRLVMRAYRLSEPAATGFTNQYNPTGMVDYEHAAFRTYPERNATMGDWFTFAPNMRFEIRYRRSDNVGFNNAIWFQGNVQGVPWPDYGEIDLFENPKKEINQTMHSTLHSANFYSGKNNAKTATVTLDDMKRWNIYWIEMYPEQIVMGVNGHTVFRIDKGANGYSDWPWDQEDGFYLILSTGMNDNKRPGGWQGSVKAADFADPASAPSMEFDWIRVYVNGDYDRSPAKNIYY